MSEEDAAREALRQARSDLLETFMRKLERPMIALAFVWLALFIVEAVRGLTPGMRILGSFIWAAFAVEFVVGFVIAPRKLAYLRHNGLKAVALAAPALRIYRVAAVLRLARLGRAAGLARSLRLLRLISSLNRGMNALGRTMRRRGFAYVMVSTLVVVFAGAAGMYGFEGAPAGQPGLASYAESLWWTAMLMTTMGSEYWPRSPEGRALCLALAIYAFSVFGYVTATLASFFVGRDTEEDGAQAALEALRAEVAALREALGRR